ncbi:hypothetical protein DFJ43DRAFT_414324 [Lentinula guzmanii]|uniref:Zn(2)-C6 fungal-type domain-containing protein n=1 Tax=Lentinula guzmanii TaxID=2804957 RepID=A0AA38MT95_9AGAR|nr:hypothetical protein DFJ43DRAFT_414324 [Lentinula guzmanii]
MASRVNSNSRRSRAAQACITCRKHKARCELLDDLKTTEVLRCHRCKTLDLRCSYEDADRQSLRLGRKSGIQAWEQLVDLTDVEPVSRPHSSTTTATTTISSRNTEPQLSREEYAPVAATSAALDLGILPQSIWNYRRVETGQWRYCGTDNDNDHYDWTAPMSAIYQISAQYQARIHKRAPVTSLQRGGQAQPELFEDILEQSQIEELLRIFHQSFSPWLGFSVTHSNSFPLLKLVCCTIASRKSKSTSSLVADRLLYAAEHALSQIIIRPPPAYILESIQALILIALWTPLSSSNEPEEGWSDPHLLLSSAVSLATKIRLNEAPDKYSMLRNMREQGLAVDPLQLTSAANLARLWISLTNAESALCIGTHRRPFSRRDKAYLRCFPRYPSNFSQSALDGNAEASDVRLRLLAETLSATEEAFSLQLNSIQEFESWHHALTDALQRIDSCARILLPLKYVQDLDQALIFRAQTVISRCCRLLVIHNPVNVSRRLSLHHGPGILTSHSHSNVFSEVFTPLGKDALRVCEEIFVSLQELLENVDRNAYDHFLASAPDYFFHLILHAGIFITSFKFMIFNARKSVLPGASDLLLERIIHHLRLLQVPKMHPAKKCANLLGGLLELWQSRDNFSFLPPQQEPSGANQHGCGVDGHEQEQLRNRGLGGSSSSRSSASSPPNTAAIATLVSEYSFSSSLGETCTTKPRDVAISQSGLDINGTSVVSMPILDGATMDVEWSDVLQDAQFWQNFLMQQPMFEQQQ